MNSSDLANYTVSFTDLSRIMKNLRNAFIYTASTQQRNGNFQQWLSYNALCLGKATPSHCILETMRPCASANSSSHRLTGRSLPAFFPLLAVPWIPGGLPPHRPSGIHSISIQPVVARKVGPCPKGASWKRCTGASLWRGAISNPINPQGSYCTLQGIYMSGLYAELGVREQPRPPLPLPRTDC